MRVTIVSLIIAAASLAGPALAAHNHPQQAKKLQLSLVEAYAQCLAPNDAHKPALAFPSCSPPTLATAADPTHQITFGPKGKVSVQIKVLKGDVEISFKGKDILDNGSPFSGSLTAGVTLRVTDHGSGAPSFTTPATIIDIPFPITVGCTAGACKGKFAVNTVLAGAVSVGDEGNIELSDLGIRDPDGDDCFRPGLFIP